MFHDRTIASLYEKYAQEQVECDLLADVEGKLQGYLAILY